MSLTFDIKAHMGQDLNSVDFTSGIIFARLSAVLDPQFVSFRDQLGGLSAQIHALQHEVRLLNSRVHLLEHELNATKSCKIAHSNSSSSCANGIPHDQTPLPIKWVQSSTGSTPPISPERIVHPSLCPNHIQNLLHPNSGVEIVVSSSQSLEELSSTAEPYRTLTLLLQQVKDVLCSTLDITLKRNLIIKLGHSIECQDLGSGQRPEWFPQHVAWKRHLGIKECWLVFCAELLHPSVTWDDVDSSVRSTFAQRRHSSSTIEGALVGLRQAWTHAAELQKKNFGPRLVSLLQKS